MRVDDAEVRRLAALARLRLDAAEIERMRRELSTILDYIDLIKAVDTSGARLPSTDPTPLRADVPGESLDLEDVGANAPRFENGFFVVPRIIGER